MRDLAGDTPPERAGRAAAPPGGHKAPMGTATGAARRRSPPVHSPSPLGPAVIVIIATCSGRSRGSYRDRPSGRPARDAGITHRGQGAADTRLGATDEAALRRGPVAIRQQASGSGQGRGRDQQGFSSGAH